MLAVLRASLVFIVSLLPACAPVDMLNATISENGLLVLHDVPYAPGPRRSMDIYRLDSAAAPRPVVVFFYGGAWQDGSKNDYLFAAAALARAGYVVVVPDYRVYPEGAWPVFLQDSARALATVQHLAANWGGDPGRVFVVGHSAGGHIAAMLALDPQWLAAAGGRRDALAGMVGISGPYDFLPITGPDIKLVFAPADADLTVTQPIDQVDGHNPPMLLLQGEADHTVGAYNAKNLYTKIKAADGDVTLKLYPGVGHIGIIASLAPLLRSRAPTLADTTAFIDAQKSVPPPVW